MTHNFEVKQNIKTQYILLVIFNLLFCSSASCSRVAIREVVIERTTVKTDDLQIAAKKSKKKTSKNKSLSHNQRPYEVHTL